MLASGKLPMKGLNRLFLCLGLASFIVHSNALKFDPDYISYNLNQNESATNVLDYYGIWEDHTFQPSPANWRFPFYTIFLDRFVNGDPTNDNANGTLFETDMMQTQLRHGGDLQGIIDSLDYIQGMRIKALYIAGSPFINMPWEADQYAPVDLSLLDFHGGNISIWRTFVTEVHNRGMYVILDNTMATMGDLIGFQGYLNTSTPFLLKEHHSLWKYWNRRHLDFDISNVYNESCQYPRFWNETGYPIDADIRASMVGCYESEFDQYGDTEAFGVFPDYQRELSKFASVQDRLRDWNPSVRDKIKVFSCNLILMLDIDGFRIDKATQITVDALADFSNAMRQCARSVGKENFFIPGEITGGNTFGSIFLGRGKQPNMQFDTLLDAVSPNQSLNSTAFIRDGSNQALDAAAFHYSVYRTLTRFLGMDGDLEAGYDTPLNWVQAWNDFLMTNDLINANTNLTDPRHMYGVTNQDVFRWPAISLGNERMLLGLYMTTLHLPGIPLLMWGEEQSFYVFDNTANNYLYGRQAMSYSQAWQLHGCYKLGSTQYYQFSIEAALDGCGDDWNSLDHRDPTSPLRLILKSMYQMRENYPVLNDGWYLQQLSNLTHNVLFPGSSGVPTETGIWSIFRSLFDNVQNFTGQAAGNEPIWLVYHNDNETVDYNFDCSSNETAIISPFVSGETVKNLFYPYEEMTLISGPQSLGFNGSALPNGCTQNLTLEPFAFKAYVLTEAWMGPDPMIVRVSPTYDARLVSAAVPGAQENVSIEISFSMSMSCASVTNSLVFISRTEDNSTPFLEQSSIVCADVPSGVSMSNLTGSLPAFWTFSANVLGVADGIHSFTVQNASNADGSRFTNGFDKFIFRVGQQDNPMVFPRSANYTLELLHQDISTGDLYLLHKAAGADQWRYSLNWGSSFSEWEAYYGGNSTLVPQYWSGTSRQSWSGQHVIVQYYNRITGSSDYQQHADLDASGQFNRRFPHIFAHGPFNQFGYDSGIRNDFSLVDDGTWRFDFITEWPAVLQINIWGINPDGQPDQTGVYGDVDGDSILDRVPPTSLSDSSVNISVAPPVPYLGWRLTITDGDLRFTIEPIGHMTRQIVVFILLCLVPLSTAILAVYLFKRFFYQVKHNKAGVEDKSSALPRFIQSPVKRLTIAHRRLKSPGLLSLVLNKSTKSSDSDAALSNTVGVTKRRTVLIATMEYDIEDWDIKIKIGGLGVMAQLMGKSLGHVDLIWVVPCVEGVNYPDDEPAPSMNVTVMGKRYEVKVQYHRMRNITYVLLDAPVFRGQTKTEPYPARMDDLSSAVYYSAWNQCIALAIKRFPIDLYHINDYHGALAPLHLLPKTIPVALSLHNAEFQGLWPMRSSEEIEEVCDIYNVPVQIAKSCVQFGDVFNLLHAGSSYLRLHQKGFGAVGVSKKYGKRSWARYPIFWGLSEIGQLPNPDPTDTEKWNKKQDDGPVVINEDFEIQRAGLRRQAQAWANLELDPDAELFVFVGRWSMQKGIDLIADIMPSVLEEHKKVQLICVGPVIDLHGKFAALKLAIMMKKYPGRVCSKPEFTALPPYIFSGAEFALIPSRDEPFGLVAVEFGRKGALGVGARVGGLGQMPGWWFSIESTTTSHLLSQFKITIEEALACKKESRQRMRAISARQRFPVAQWVEDLEILQARAIKLHKEVTRATIIHRPRKARRLPKAKMNSIDSSDDESLPLDRADPQRYVSAPDTAKKVDGFTKGNAADFVSLGMRKGPHDEKDVDTICSSFSNSEEDQESDAVHEVPPLEELISLEEAQVFYRHQIGSETSLAPSAPRESSLRLDHRSSTWSPGPRSKVKSFMADFQGRETEQPSLSTQQHTSDRLDRQFNKLKIQEWAGLNPDEHADILIYIGRWSMEKGIDIIADVIPPIMKMHDSAQFICIGPVFDMYGQFAEAKFQAISRLYPGRLYSDSKSLKIPEFVLEGVDFALMPSREGLEESVDADFQRYGILPIGSRAQEQETRSGWWYVPESSAVLSSVQQLKQAVSMALTSTEEERDSLRQHARSSPIHQGWEYNLRFLHQAAMESLQGQQNQDDPTLPPRSDSLAAGSDGRSTAFDDEYSIPVRGSSREICLSTGTLESDEVDRLCRNARNVQDPWTNPLRTTSSLPTSFFESRDASVTQIDQTAWLYANALALVENAPLIPVRSSSVDPAFQWNTKSQIGVSSLLLRLSRWIRSAPQYEEDASFIGPANAQPDLTHRRRSLGGQEHFHRALRMVKEDVLIPGRISSVEVWVEDFKTADYRGSHHADPKKPRKAIRIVREEPASIPGRISSLEIWIEDQDHDTEHTLANHNEGTGDHTASAKLDTLAKSTIMDHTTIPITQRGASYAWTADTELHRPRAVRIQIRETISTLSLQSIVGDRKDFNLQNVDPFFTDSDEEYFKLFESSLSGLSGSNSDTTLCIEAFLEKSEKEWFSKYRAAKMRKPERKPRKDAFEPVPMDSPTSEKMPTLPDTQGTPTQLDDLGIQSLLGGNHRPPSALKRFMSRRVGDWPIYSLFLAVGQITSANSYQISLLSGTVGQDATKLYAIASIYLLSSVSWWIAHRNFKAVHVLTLPFLIYGLAFFILGVAPYAPSISSRGWVQNTASALYAVAAASGSLYFSLNFGDEGGSRVESWVYRACIIQGTQQIYVCTLWLWGDFISAQSEDGQNLQQLLAGSSVAPVTKVLSGTSFLITAVTMPIAICLWIFGIIIYLGLPEYYRHRPGSIPAFYGSLFRRNIIIWFFITVIIQNLFLSAPYGRNWKYLWESQSAQIWQITCLVFLFFVVIWAGVLLVLGKFSKHHSWLIPIFATGLGAPRWGQMLWSCTTIGLHLPWTGSAVASALLGRALWLWLGVLDAIQNVGFGMILLQTLTRPHITFTLIAAQVVGSAVTIIARAIGPDSTGPGNVFPDFSTVASPGLSQPWFWIALILQLVICFGFLKFFRKEQLLKP